jgi:DNA-binding protein
MTVKTLFRGENMKHAIPLAAMERILKNAGAYRVSEESKVALRQVLEDIAMEIGEESIRLANHAGRKTVKAEDIRLASH